MKTYTSYLLAVRRFHVMNYRMVRNPRAWNALADRLSDIACNLPIGSPVASKAFDYVFKCNRLAYGYGTIGGAR